MRSAGRLLKKALQFLPLPLGEGRGRAGYSDRRA